MTTSNALPTTTGQQPQQPQLPPPDPRRTRFLFTHRCPRCRNIPPANVDVVHDETGEVSCLLERGYKLRWCSDTNEIECACGETFELPEHLWRTPEQKTPKARKSPANPVSKSKKPVKKAVNPKPKQTVKKKKTTNKKATNKGRPAAESAKAAKARYMQMDEEALTEAGLGDRNHRRFLLDALNTGKFKYIGSDRPDTTDWLLEIARHWNLKQILEDLEAIKDGNKTEMECCTKEHFLNTVLRGTMFPYFDDWNAAELARIMPELYGRELERCRKAGRTASEKAIEDAFEDAECHVTQVLASGYRGCDVRTISRMLKKNKRFRCKHGKPSVDFLIRERNSKK